MLERFKSYLGIGAATTLAPVDEPKVKKGAQARPSYLRTAKPNKDTTLPLSDRRLATTDLSRVSRNQSTREIVRQLAHASPDLSAAVSAYLRTGITRKYTAVARNMDGTINPEATGLTQQLLTRFDLLPGYAQGFGGIGSLRTHSESWAKELIMYGGAAGELVLGPDSLPQRIQPLTTTTIEFKPDKEGLNPVQKVSGDEINLDLPTFFYVALDMELMEAYPSSPIESAIQPIQFSEQFMSDIRRVVRRAVHPRMTVVIDEEAFIKHMPPNAQHDETAAADYYTRMVADLEEKLNSLEPDEALVHSDILTITTENNGNISWSAELETLENMANAKLATGSKVTPTMLGHNNGSSNIASTETLIFMKQVEGAVQFKLNEMYSRILTLAVRLFGQDVYVEFKYDAINLRPDAELESFRSMEQSRVLELLSLGLISDEEAAIQLTGHLPPEGYVPLAGTQFQSKQASTMNPYDGESNDGSTTNQNLGKDVPKGAKGQNNKKNPVKEGK